MELRPISNKEFGLFKSFIYEHAGISLSDSKQPLVSGRLAKRLRSQGLKTYTDYYSLITNPKHIEERQIAIDLLTTNETHFFREPKHFDFMRNHILPKRTKGRNFRVWSAASSSGEEPYTIAMLLAEHLNTEPWEVIASDISTRVLEQARTGYYPISRAEEIPRHYLTKYCLKGTGDHADKLLIVKELRQKVAFTSINLTKPYPALGEFDVIFLRNVMIYFDIETKRQITQQMLPLLRPGGYFIISHSESLNGISNAYEAIMPSVYRKPQN
jgi:chemotaxis protein methyltransferase CheR